MATYKCVVATVTPHLRCRTSPGRKSNNLASMKLYTGDTFMSSQTAICSEGLTWYKNDATGYWSSSTEDGKTLLKVTSLDNNAKTVPATNKATSASRAATGFNSVRENPNTIEPVTNSQQMSDVVSNRNLTAAADTGNTSTIRTSGAKGYDIVNSRNFPMKNGENSYDYTTNVNTVSVDGAGTSGESFIQEIRENLNIYSSWSKFTINNKYHTEFNRFKLEHPDIFLRNTIGYIVFTRPDLNLFNEAGTLHTQISVDPRVNYIALQNPHLAQSLTHSYDGTTGHNFNPFLSNLAQSLEVMDDNVDTLDVGETFTGYKFQYSKHNIKSITSGSLNIKFKETFDLGITNLFQLWVDYQSNVYRGVYVPKDDYIWYKNIDYMCNIYYFLLDQDGETLLFWSKYFGAFPTNVPKSVLSFDTGSQVQLPDMNVTFSYIYKEDLSPATLVEFNKDAGLSGNGNVTYLPNYNAKLGHSGRTWAGVPFVSSYTYNNGITSNAYGFKFRFRAPEDLNQSVSHGVSDAASASRFSNGAMSRQQLTDRELVQQVAKLQDNTMEYLDKWNWSDELYRKAANAIRNQSAAGSTQDAASIIQSATGFMDHTMEYLDNWTWGEELMSKLSDAMKNGV